MKHWFITLVLAAVPLFCSAGDKSWPFDQPKNVAVITLKQIVFEKAPILRVTHDVDGWWQFLNPNFETIESNASLVSLEQITKRDPSILELADLPTGWCAWRARVGVKWVREKLPSQEPK